MKDPAKGREQAIGRNINAYIFLTIGDTPINVHIERKLKISRFWKCKKFWFFMLFCIQNGNWVKIWIFGFQRSGHNIYATAGTASTYLPILYWKRVYMCKIMLLIFFMLFCTQNGIWRFLDIGDQNFWGRKIDFFRFFQNVF